MNDPVHDFKIWFDGFCAALCEAPTPDTDQWKVLKKYIEMLTLEQPLNVPKLKYDDLEWRQDKFGMDRPHVPKDAPSSMDGGDGPSVPRYPDEKPL